MKKTVNFLCVFMAILFACTSICISIPPLKSEAATATEVPDVKEYLTNFWECKEVLFVGNSKTASYGSPAKSFEKLANANAMDHKVPFGVNVTICAKGGNTLLQTANTPEYANIITKKKYDIVILQEGRKPYLAQEAGQYEKYLEGVTKIAEMVRKKNPNVQIYIRQVWVGKEYGTVDDISGGGQKKGKFYCGQKEVNGKPIPIICTTADKQRAYKNTNTIAERIKAAGVIYDGYVMGSYNNRYIKIEDKLFQSDKYHQSDLGSALAATAIYASVYKKMPSVMNSDTFYRSERVKNIATGKYYGSSKCELILTKGQIDRIKTVVKDKYGY